MKRLPVRPLTAAEIARAEEAPAGVDHVRQADRLEQARPGLREEICAAALAASFVDRHEVWSS